MGWASLGLDRCSVPSPPFLLMYLLNLVMTLAGLCGFLLSTNVRLWCLVLACGTPDTLEGSQPGGGQDQCGPTAPEAVLRESVGLSFSGRLGDLADGSSLDGVQQ